MYIMEVQKMMQLKRLNLFSFAAARANHLRDGWQIVREGSSWCILVKGAEKIALVRLPIHNLHFSRANGIYC